MKVDDYNHENEAYLIAKQISNKIKIVNEYSESEYLLAASINNQWPLGDIHVGDSGELHRLLTDIDGTEVYISNDFNEIKTVSVKGFESMDALIRNSQQFRLTNIIVDNDKNQPIFLQELMDDEKLYPYLVKEFDSKEFGYEYHVKVFEIDYNYFQ